MLKNRKVILFLVIFWLSSMVGGFLLTKGYDRLLSGVSPSSTEGQLSSTGVVTFDTARYLNARRASMAKLLNQAKHGNYSSNPAAVIAKVDRLARPVIEKIAAGRLVVVKQALALDKQVPDITDAVIKKLGLPDVKTTIATPSVDDMATNFATSTLYEQVKQWFNDSTKKAKERLPKMRKQNIKQLNQQIIP